MTAWERAMGLIAELTSLDTGYDCCLTGESAINVIRTALADAERGGIVRVMDEGSLWSFLRSVLSQGGAIQQDYQAGKYNDYEEYSARLDCAARERARQWITQAKAQAREEA